MWVIVVVSRGVLSKVSFLARHGPGLRHFEPKFGSDKLWEGVPDPSMPCDERMTG